MRDTLHISAGRVGRFLSQHFWNIEAANGLLEDGRPAAHAQSSFYETKSGAVPRLVTFDYKDNYGPVPWAETQVEAEVESFEPENVINQIKELSKYHRYFAGTDEEENKRLYTDAGARFFHAWKQIRETHRSNDGYPGISDVRIDFQQPDRFPTDFAEPGSTSPFAYELPRADVLDLPSDYYTEMAVIGGTTAMVDGVYNMIMKQLERCDSLDCLLLSLGADTHWGTPLVAVLDEVLPEIPRVSTLIYDVVDHGPQISDVHGDRMRSHPLLTPSTRKGAQLKLWMDLADRIGSCALSPLSLSHADRYPRGRPTYLSGIDANAVDGNYLRTNAPKSLSSATALLSLAAYSFMHQSRLHSYRISSLLEALVPTRSGNVLANSLNISLIGDFYASLHDLGGLELSYLKYSINTSLAAVRGFLVDSLGMEHKPKGWVNSYVSRYSELFREPIIQNRRGSLFRGPVLKLPVTFPHFFNDLYGLCYRTELPLAFEVRNTPYYYANLRSLEGIFRKSRPTCIDRLDFEEIMQHLCAMKEAYRPPRCIEGLELTEDENSD